MSDASTVRPHLERWFKSRRVVFWHDPDSQYAEDLDGLDLPGVQTIRVANDEFGIKNRLLHDEPTSKFLVYRSGEVPTGIGNWLLDLELAYGVCPQIAPPSWRRISDSLRRASARSSWPMRSSSMRPSAFRA